MTAPDPPAEACGVTWTTHWPDEDEHLCRVNTSHSDHVCACGATHLIDPPAVAGVGAEPWVTVLVSRDLLNQLGEWSQPVQIRIVETPGVGTGWDMTARTVPDPRAQVLAEVDAALRELTPEYDSLGLRLVVSREDALNAVLELRDTLAGDGGEA